MTKAASCTAKPSSFLQGSLWVHIASLASASGLGLTLIYVVDLLDALYLAALDDEVILSAIGVAGSFLVIIVSANLALVASAVVSVSRLIGGERANRAKVVASRWLLFGCLFSSAFSVLAMLLSPALLRLLLGEGSLVIAPTLAYLNIVLPSSGILVIGMMSAGFARAKADIRTPLHGNVVLAVINAVLAPLFIFSLGGGIEGAAWASVLARLGFAGFHLRCLNRRHQLLRPVKWRNFLHYSPRMLKVAIPMVCCKAILPLAQFALVGFLAHISASAVAGWAVIQRVKYVVFPVIYALPVTLNPIYAQHVGAGKLSRLHVAGCISVRFALLLVLAGWLFLLLIQELLVNAFHLQGDSAQVLRLFCQITALEVFFKALIFIAQSYMLSVNKPCTALVISVLKASVGTVPFVWFGGLWFGFYGVLLGDAMGSALIAWVAMRWVRRDEARLRAVRAKASKEANATVLQTPAWDDRQAD